MNITLHMMQQLQQTIATFITIGVTLAATDVITVYASSANLSFSAFGSEIS
jgi:hypothetical protein